MPIALNHSKFISLFCFVSFPWYSFFRCPVFVEWSQWTSLSWLLSTTTITADVEDHNVLHDLFLSFDAKDLTSERLKQSSIYRRLIKIQLLSVLQVCAADAAECFVRCHTESVECFQYESPASQDKFLSCYAALPLSPCLSLSHPCSLSLSLKID